MAIFGLGCCSCIRIARRTCYKLPAGSAGYNRILDCNSTAFVEKSQGRASRKTPAKQNSALASMALCGCREEKNLISGCRGEKGRKTPREHYENRGERRITDNLPLSKSGYPNAWTLPETRLNTATKEVSATLFWTTGSPLGRCTAFVMTTQPSLVAVFGLGCC